MSDNNGSLAAKAVEALVRGRFVMDGDKVVGEDLCEGGKCAVAASYSIDGRDLTLASFHDGSECEIVYINGAGLDMLVAILKDMGLVA